MRVYCVPIAIFFCVMLLLSNNWFQRFTADQYNMVKQRVCFLVIVLVCGLCNSVFSQLNLYKEHGVVQMGSVELFLEKNDFEYAIIAHHTSSRILNEREFSCLVKQNSSWYLFRISEASVISPAPKLRLLPTVKRKKLTNSQADSLLNIIEPQKGMSHTQEEFYTLPSTCESEFRGRKGITGGVSDASTYHLAEKSDKGVNSLSFYAADFYLRNCLPLNAQFKILTGMVNSVDKLTSAASSL